MSVKVEIRNLTKKYGKVTALDRINLDISSGEFIVLLGPSGCGKTTLLRCIAGLEEPDEGEIIIGDQVVFSSRRNIIIPPGQRRLGMVFQTYALWPHMTVFENIGFGVRLQKKSRKETQEIVERVLEDLSMEGLMKRYPSQISGGQQQRVAVARLLATKPKVFLMDEPLSNLDARLRYDMRSELKRLHYESGSTTVYVTHDQTEAMTMATRIVVMKEGRIHQIGSAKEVYFQPADIFVAKFIGMPRVNLFSVKVVMQASKSRLEVDDFTLRASWVPSNKELAVAVRPEDIKIFLEPQPDGVEFSVYVVQPSGSEQIVYLRRGKTNLIVREIHQLDLRIDQSIWIKIDPSAFNFYDEKTGSLLKQKEGN